MLTAIVLTVIAIIFRSVTPALQIWNFVPMGAVSLFAGSRLPRRWAWAVPLMAMVCSDLLLDYGTRRPIFELTRWTVYATFALITLLGQFANHPKMRRWLLPVLSLSGSSLFFLTSNLATWGEGRLYPMTFAGLIACYTEAIPFFGNTVAADLLGTAALFSLGPFFERAAQRLTRPRLAEIQAEVSAPESSRPA